MDDITPVPGELARAPSEATTIPIILAPTTSSTHTRIDVRTPPPPPRRTDSDTVVVQPGVPRGAFEEWMQPVLAGPATRGDMELLGTYLITPPASRPTLVSTPLGNQFFDFNVSAVMDSFYRRLQGALLVPVQDDESFFLDAQDWQSKLGDAERVLLDSVKRFILHTAIYAARARPDDFAFDRDTADGRLHESRLEKVDCLQDFVDDVVALAGYLKDSCKLGPDDELPSLKEFIRDRVLMLAEKARQGRRQPRRYFFKPNSERSTHEYARKACCVVLGLTDDYDQSPEFGLTDWSRRVLVFDNLKDLLWKGFGLSFKGLDKHELTTMTGSIVDLDANFITTGPFQFHTTTRVQEHLTLDRAGHIRIYTSKALASTGYMFQSHIIARAAGISSLGLEIARSYALFFLQTETARSKHLAKTLNLDLETVSLSKQIHPYDFKTIFYDSLHWGNIPRLEDFELLRPRLFELGREMNDWRPQKVSDLFRRGYKDPLTWYGFWFAGFVGVIAILSLGVSIIQTAKAF